VCGCCSPLHVRLVSCHSHSFGHSHSPIAFPSPQEEKEQYQVRDEHGKIVEIPRPVHALRIWNAKLRKYDILSAHLDGAPSDKDAADYWKNMLQKLRDMRGAEYIDGLMEEINSS